VAKTSYKCIILMDEAAKSGTSKTLIARNLRRLRLARSWSQYDLAEKAKVRQALVSALEVATANPTLETLDRVAAALGVEIAELAAAQTARAR
jgi:transcriptional regulator with XRE-family HTH domain